MLHYVWYRWKSKCMTEISHWLFSTQLCRTWKKFLIGQKIDSQTLNLKTRCRAMTQRRGYFIFIADLIWLHIIYECNDIIYTLFGTAWHEQQQQQQQLHQATGMRDNEEWLEWWTCLDRQLKPTSGCFEQRINKNTFSAMHLNSLSTSNSVPKLLVFCLMILYLRTNQSLFAQHGWIHVCCDNLVILLENTASQAYKNTSYSITCETCLKNQASAVSINTAQHQLIKTGESYFKTRSRNIEVLLATALLPPPWCTQTINYW